MTRSSLVALLGGSALVGGIAGATVTRLINPPVSSSGQPAAKREPAASPADGVLSDRVEALELSMRSVEQRLDALTRAVAVAQFARGAATAEQPQPTEKRSLVDDPVFEAAVLDVVERSRDAPSAARSEERRLARGERWANQVGERLGLSQSQRDGLREVRNEVTAKIQGIYSPDGGAELTVNQRLNQADAIRTEGQAKIHALLDARQRAEYDKLEPWLQMRPLQQPPKGGAAPGR